MKKAEKVVFRGEWAEVAEWVKAQWWAVFWNGDCRENKMVAPEYRYKKTDMTVGFFIFSAQDLVVPGRNETVLI